MLESQASSYTSRRTITRPERSLCPTRRCELLIDFLTKMADGNAVTWIPVHAERSCPEAAKLLNASRPYLPRLLDEMKFPFCKVGAHQRRVIV